MLILKKDIIYSRFNQRFQNNLILKAMMLMKQ